MTPTETDWASVVSAGIPALAAVFGTLAGGLIQGWLRNGDRKHERLLKAEESRREDARLVEQRAREHIESQRDAVKTFLHAVREQQSIALQEQVPFFEDFRDAKERDPDGFEERSWEFENRLGERTGNLANVGRRKMIEAWEMMDASLVDENLRLVSNEVKQALQDTRAYGNTRLFPGLVIPFPDKGQDLEPLLHQLREASADLLHRHPEHYQSENRSSGK